MKTSTRRIASLFLAAGLLTIGSWHLAAADLTIDQIRTNTEVWPNQIKVSELLDYTSVKIPAGTLVDFLGFQGKDARFEYRGQFFLIEPETTDLAARANDIASGKAAAQGWHGRTADYIVRKAQQVTTAGFAPVKADTIKDDTIFVVYYGSSECGFCAAALPFMNHTLDLLEQRFPGRIVRVFSSGEANTPAVRNYEHHLGTSWIAAPAGDQYLWTGLPALVPGAASAVNYPAIALVTPKGKFLAAAMRQQNGTAEVDVVLRKLEEMLSSSSKTVASVK